jgi:cytochrome c oxidase assembly factor CtaG
MMVAPPLLWLGAPLLPLWRGLPRGIFRAWSGRLFAWRALADIGQWLVYPPVAWLVYVGSTWAWHTPALYERALASEFWHELQHACLLAAALAFWWPVVQPWPSRSLVPRWAIVLYLILADVQNTILGAWLVFAERLIYPSYATVSSLWGISALNDQAAAGAIMWVPGSIAFLLPIVWIVAQLLSPQGDPATILSHQHVAVGRLRLHGRGNGAE